MSMPRHHDIERTMHHIVLYEDETMTRSEPINDEVIRDIPMVMVMGW